MDSTYIKLSPKVDTLFHFFFFLNLHETLFPESSEFVFNLIQIVYNQSNYFVAFIKKEKVLTRKSLHQQT